jgi:hypothetical protein
MGVSGFMSKFSVTYEFDPVTDGEDIVQLMQYKDTINFAREFSEYLRQLNKYSESETIKISEVYNKFWEIINDYKIEL